MIIVEGFDNTGKTTLAEHLSDAFGLPILTRRTTGADGIPFIMETLSILILEPLAILERHPVTAEWVYGPILRDKNALNEDPILWDYWVRKLLRSNPLVIYCRPPDDLVFNFGTRKQMDGVIDKSKSILDRYDLLFWELDNRGFSLIRYDYSEEGSLPTVDNSVNLYLITRENERRL